MDRRGHSRGFKGLRELDLTKEALNKITYIYNFVFTNFYIYVK